jgi:hypothetical protein
MRRIRVVDAPPEYMYLKDRALDLVIGEDSCGF